MFALCPFASRVFFNPEIKVPGLICEDFPPDSQCAGNCCSVIDGLQTDYGSCFIWQFCG